MRKREPPARAEGMADLAQARLFRPRRDRRALALRHHASDDRDDPPGRGLGAGLAHHQGDGRQFPPGDGALLRRAGCRELGPGRLRHRDRLLRLLVAGLGLPGEVRLSDRDHDRARQYRHRRQRAEPGRRAGLRRFPALAGRAGGAARALDPPPAGEPGRLRQGAGRTTRTLQGSLPRRAREVRRRGLGEAHGRGRHALRPARHLPARCAEGRDPCRPRCRGGAREEGQFARPRARQGGARPHRRDAGHGGRSRLPADGRAPSPAARRRARARPSSSSNGRPSPSERYAQAKAKAEEAQKLAR